MADYNGIQISKIDFRPFSGTGSLAAYADVQLNGVITLTGFRVIRRQDGNLFAAPPSTKSKKTKEDGSPIYYDDIRFPDAWYEEKHNPFCDEIVSAFKKQQGGNTSTTPKGTPQIPF